MARTIGQMIRRGSSTWLVRIYVGRNPETRKHKSLDRSVEDDSQVRHGRSTSN